MKGTKPGASQYDYGGLGPFSWRVDKRVLLYVGIVAVISLFFVCWALTIGTLPLSLDEVLSALIGTAPQNIGFVVIELRLPRIFAAFLVGGLLAVSGALFQGIARNPLASPDIIGINGGAAAVAVALIILGLPAELRPIGAFVGALGAALLVYLLSWKGHLSVERLVLVGIGINAVADAIITFLLTRGNIQDVSKAYQWMAGSLYTASMTDVTVLALAMLVSLPLAAVLMPALRIMQLGDAAAKSAGLRVEPARLGILVAACAMSGFAVSVSGLIAFVALIVPHIARSMAPRLSLGSLLLNALLGGCLVLGADLLAQHLLEIVLPAGIVTSALGAPGFVYLLYRARRRGELAT